MWNARFFVNFSILCVDMLHVEHNTALGGCEPKTEEISAERYDLLDVELLRTPTTTEKVLNLFLNCIKGLKYDSRQEYHKKPVFMLSMEGKI